MGSMEHDAKKTLRKRNIVFIALAAILTITAIWTIWGNTALELNRITVTSGRLPEGFDGYRIAHVSDLHNTEFGDNNKKLLEILKEAEPDIIAITGDMIDSYHTDIAVAISFAREAVKIAPCYYVTGNHESRIKRYNEFEDGLTDAGVTILRDSSAVLERNGEMICLIGFDDPDFYAAEGFLDETPSMISARLSKLMDEAQGYTLLLSHRPELFDIYSANGADLVLSGHAHGGQIRLPFAGGLIAPGQGFFPKYDAGLYTSGSSAMIVSRGLGNSIAPLRINNRPELVLLELQSG